MSHHLTPEKHLEIHQAHTKAVGMYSSSVYTINIPLSPATSDFKETTLYIEICVQCGIIDKTYCQHGASVWKHRPGCALWDSKENQAHGVVGPAHMYTHLSETWPDQSTLLEEKGDPVGTEKCQGCLLVCPVCKADGT